MSSLPQSVGNGVDYAAQVTGTISSAEGTFPTVTGVTSESGAIGNSGPPVSNAYTLQLNTKPFSTPVCAGHPTCTGWEQFVYFNSGTGPFDGSLFIQFWLKKYNAPCPAGWNQFSFTASSDIYCWEDNAGGSTTGPGIAITSLSSLKLTASASGGGNDSVILSGAGSLTATNTDSALDLASAWDTVEFIVAGPGGNSKGGSQAMFNPGSTINVETTVHNGTTNAPTCVAKGYTGETNNLTITGTPTFTTAPSPAIETVQTNISGPPGSCAAAKGVGDPHLQTFNGLLYDFQATGDFLLAQANNFTVQSRQVSGAPIWPNAAVNQALATQMGADRVALCTGPPRVAVDGTSTQLADGQTITLPSGVTIARTGNVYLVTDPSGNYMRGVMNPSWIDASVGLGNWPEPVQGLLANANGNVNQLQTSDGTVLTVPVPFEELYHRYADSWRVPPAASLLSDCGRETQQGIPGQPFFARDLDPQTRQNAQAICMQAGVREPTLIDPCTLDVAVLGSNAAAAYVGAAPPVLVGN